MNKIFKNTTAKFENTIMSNRMPKLCTHQWSLARGDSPCDSLYTRNQRFDETATVDNGVAGSLCTEPTRWLVDIHSTHIHALQHQVIINGVQVEFNRHNLQ